MFIKIGGQEHLNKRKSAYELSHVKLVISTMIGVVWMNPSLYDIVNLFGITPFHMYS